jgi:hypothetical protein
LPPIRVQTPPAPITKHRVIRERADITNNAPGPAVVNGGSGGYWEALRQSPDRTQLPYMVNARRARFPILDGLNRMQLAALGRYLVDNGGTASYAVGLIRDYSTPVIPQAASDEDDWNKQNEADFAAWSKVADFTGRFSLSQLEEIISTLIDTDGDIGAAMTMKHGFPQVRLYESFDIGAINGTHKTDGVLYDTDGVVGGYNVIEGFSPNERQRALSRNEMILLYDVDRYSRYRGLSPFRRGSNDLRDSNDIKGFTKLATKIASALAGVIKGGTIEENLWGDDETAEADGGNKPADDALPSRKKLTMAELLGGDIPVIDGEWQQITNPNPSTNTVDFLGTLNGSFVSGLSLPPAFYLDEKLTGPNIRGVLSKAQKKFNKRICTICSFVEFVYVRWTAWRIETGQIKAVKNWDKVTFQLPPKLVIDLGDQMSNEREDVLVGQMSRQERSGNRGRDWMRDEDQITAEQTYIIKSCQKLATALNVPLELVMQARGFTGPAREQAKEDTSSNNKKNAEKSKESK